MKNIIFLLVIMLATVLFSSSCSKDEVNELDGDTNIPMNQVGNIFQGGVLVNNVFVPGYSSEVIASNNGVATIEFIYDFSAVAELAFIDDLIPEELKDATGKLNTQADIKMTTNGILDYTNADEAPFVAVKYDAKVGDKYVLKKSNGKTITRTVTARSETDDFEWGLMLIKTITVEQDSRIPGISKFVYRFNHKFGLVHVEAIAEDGTKVEAYVNSMN